MCGVRYGSGSESVPEIEHQRLNLLIAFYQDFTALHISGLLIISSAHPFSSCSPYYLWSIEVMLYLSFSAVPVFWHRLCTGFVLYKCKAACFQIFSSGMPNLLSFINKTYREKTSCRTAAQQTPLFEHQDYRKKLLGGANACQYTACQSQLDALN